MQTLARELNLSETIFAMPAAHPAKTARVRIFYHKAEIPFAGHPTIGCAVHLAGLIDTPADATVALTLEEEAGLVPVVAQSQSGRVTAEFSAPRLPVRTHVMADTALTAVALGLDPGDIDLGKPQQNGLIESFNGSLRDELLRS